jgi:serine protease Do
MDGVPTNWKRRLAADGARTRRGAIRLTLTLLLAPAACAPADARAEHEVDAAMTVAALNAPLTDPLTDLLADGPAQQRPSAAQASADLASDRGTAIVRATSRVAPAVVSISVIRTQQIRARTPWESMMLPPGASRQSAGFGSGVIVRDDGIVLTNDHVIAGADRIRVTLPDGRDLDADLIGTDPVADIAVLRVRGGDLPVAPVGTARGLMIGEWAIAIGNPLGNYVGDTQPTVTAGVVSAVNRNITPSSEDQGFYFGMIQTDAAINPGNSGGALVNAVGEVIGINASIISRGGGSEGLGFAIPIDRAMQIADDLVRHGEVRRAWVGLDVEPVEADPWGRTRGVQISRVAPGSPADQAALRAGDHLLTANGRALGGPLDWEAVLLDLRAGDRLTLAVGGQSRAVSLEAVAYPSMTAERVTVLEGIQLITVTPQIQLERGLQSTEGAYIASISEQLRGQLGLAPGDVIVAINRYRMSSADDVRRAFDALAGTGRIQMYIERGDDFVLRNFYWRR